MSQPTLLQHLDAEGYMVVPGFLDRETTDAIRAHIESLAPPIAPADLTGVKRVHDLRHPIPGALMPRLITAPLLELAQTLLKSNSLADLRLLEQVLIRTDPKPPPYGPTGWHVDWAFPPDEYEATPRRTYYHLVHACNTVVPGGAAFMIVPGSHKLTYQATSNCRTDAELAEFKKNPAELANVDLSQAIEVCANEGDLIVFNPMCLHSASGNATASSRYVYFASFFDASAKRLWNGLRASKYRDNFPDSLREGLPIEWRHLLEPSSLYRKVVCGFAACLWCDKNAVLFILF